jgi:hypothetical protein
MSTSTLGRADLHFRVRDDSPPTILFQLKSNPGGTLILRDVLQLQRDPY